MATNKDMPKDQNADKPKDQKDAYEEDHLYYVGVRGSPYANECAVFGLMEDEAVALKHRHKTPPTQNNVLNGIMLKG